MEKESGSNKSLVKKVLLASALGIGAFVITPKANQINEITNTYQGYTEDDGRTYLVFDDKIIEAREGNPDLVIQGKPDTLKIGKEYNIRYSVRNGKNHYPKKIQDIKYAKRTQ